MSVSLYFIPETASIIYGHYTLSISLLYVTNAYRDHLFQTDINNFEARRNGYPT
jgi:hypothetical protein